uniref:Kinesin motor domain-containing protein n=1 Tax=Panagrolaimus superbus TaxID=310955 RepID=A0A914YAT7_9BILA
MIENVNVFARVRPLSGEESCLQIELSRIKVNDKAYDLNYVFDESASQEDVFDIVGRPIIDGFIEGINGTIFAYGQTGSGKTYTMLGPDINGVEINKTTDGIIPRADPFFKFSMKCTFLEIYNDEIYDLLRNEDISLKKPAIRVCAGDVENVEEKKVTSYSECMELLKRGIKKRKNAETAMNRESSRSHAILMLSLVTTETNGVNIHHIRTSKLNLVDLGGSESHKHTNNSGIRQQEGSKINQSLSFLVKVIGQIIDRNPHVSFRDSKLTLLLRESLSGNAKTAILYQH